MGGLLGRLVYWLFGEEDEDIDWTPDASDKSSKPDAWTPNVSATTRRSGRS
jgi:hypothetical protein